MKQSSTRRRLRQPNPLIRAGGFLAATALLLTTVAAGIGAAAAAQDEPATPATTTTDTVLDLAATTLAPDDLPEPGFGLVYGQMLTLDESAEELAALAAGDEDETDPFDFLQFIGWQRHYESMLASPAEGSADRFHMTVTSFVTEYADVRGATLDFVLFQDEAGRPGQEVFGTTPIGDISQITRDSGVVAETGEAYQALDLLFQQGRFIAGVTIVDYTDVMPEVATAEALAATLLSRIEAAQARDWLGLSGEALRLVSSADADVAHTEEAYTRREGQTIPLFGEPATDLAAREADHTSMGIVDIYNVYADGPGGQFTYTASLLRFRSEAAAADWVAATPQRLADDPGPLVNVVPLADAGTFGHGSVTFAYEYALSDTETAHGFGIAVRVGAEVALVQLDAVPEVPLEAVELLAATQAACLAAGECPEPLPVALTAESVAAAPAPAAIDQDATSETVPSAATHQTSSDFTTNLRAEPDATAPIIEVLAPATPIEQIDEETDATGARWLQVRTEAGETGWLREIDVEDPSP